MATEQEPLGKYVISLLEKGQNSEQIEAHLLEKGHEQKFIKDLLAEASRLRHSKKRTQGLSFILGGALICFLSFLLTITSSFTAGSFPLVLYGLTSVGIVVVFLGLMKVF